MLTLKGKLSHFHNPRADVNNPYTEKLKDIICVAKSKQTIADIKTWPGYTVTPLHKMESLAEDVHVNKIWYKNESKRFGLKSFKALGGAYAVSKQLQSVLKDTQKNRGVAAKLTYIVYFTHTKLTGK